MGSPEAHGDPAPPCPPASLTRGKDLFCTSLLLKQVKKLVSQQGLEYVVTVSVCATNFKHDIHNKSDKKYRLSLSTVAPQEKLLNTLKF